MPNLKLNALQRWRKSGRKHSETVFFVGFRQVFEEMQTLFHMTGFSPAMFRQLIRKAWKTWQTRLVVGKKQAAATGHARDSLRVDFGASFPDDSTGACGLPTSQESPVRTLVKYYEHL